MSFNRMERLDIHAMEYYLALKMNKLICASTRVNLKNILLSKLNQTHKSRCCLIPHLWAPRTGNLKSGDRYQSSLLPLQGSRIMGKCPDETSWSDGNSLYLD